MKNNRFIGGTLLIAGTTIGAGMLALPISTGVAGFFPALLIFFACWLLMYWSATLFLEVNLCFEDEVNLITMARRTLGPAGEGLAWLGFLLLLYSLMAAYMAGSAPFVGEMSKEVFHFNMPSWFSPMPIIIFFGPFIFVGLQAVDRINRILMIGLLLSFVIMTAILMPHVKVPLLTHADFDYAMLSVAVVITSFGYHIIIPSLSSYLDRDVRAVKKCIMLGSILPLAVYLLWEVLVLGTVPVQGNLGIAALFSDEKLSLSHALYGQLNNASIAFAMRAFGLFAIVTSFLGVAHSLFDFLRDGLKAGNSKKARALVWLATFIPPLIFVLLAQQGFVVVLEYAGVFVALLIGVLPILMTWSVRYIQKIKGPYMASGGRFGLLLGLCAYGFIILLAVAKNAGLIEVSVRKYLAG